MTSTLCAICNEPCGLEECVVDERGRGVHKSCYLSAVTSKSARRRFDETEELLQQARELREVADRLIKKSDALIEAYKNLTGVRKQSKGERPPQD